MTFFRYRRSKPQTASSRRNTSTLRLLLIGIALLVGCFTLGLYIFFPMDALRERLEQELSADPQMQISMDSLKLTFPPALVATDIQVRAAGLPQDIVMESLQVKPLWLSLFSSNPGVKLKAQMYNGQVEANVKKRGEIEALAGSLRFELPVAPGSSIQVALTVDEIAFSGSWPIRPDTETALTASLRELSLTGMNAIGAESDTLQLGAVRVQGGGKGPALRLETIENSGGDATLAGSGTLLLTEPVGRSRVNLTFGLTPGAGFDPALRDTLGLFAKADNSGTFNLRLMGTLSNVQLR
ncbi:type II secretion system protein GspN [Desulfuromonas sp. AOP6]|uniref:type II secretion system protein GspN n=1 Tax=Desulfuromonas sp. AOP6 TaxID=1566351 RepID=UPI001272566F|nr:type II secretion system protein GspN [Desulfuromonas sp. AOP6]BCA80386.1 hypothetical protein AOP6_2173 [Desulfuromonas sp. AOP6]